MRHKKLNGIILAAAFLGVLGYVLYTDGPENLLGMFRSIRPLWMGGAVLLMLLYWLLEGGILHGVIRIFHPGQRFWRSLRTSMLGQLFNCLTPFASGGQPVQAYDMVRSGVPLGAAGSALMIKFILYQISLTVYSALVLIFYWKPFSLQVSGFGWLVFIGFAVNALVMLGLLGICFFRRPARALALWLVQLGARLRVVKDPEAARVYLDQELERFHGSFAIIGGHKGVMLWQLFLCFVQLTVFFLIPYFVLLAFGIQELSPVLVVAAQAFVVMISSFVPLPGAAGGAEFSFHTFFEPFFPAGASVNPAMLLWRVITFYLPSLVGMLFMATGSLEGKTSKGSALRASRQGD